MLLEEPVRNNAKETVATMLNIFADLSQKGKTARVCSHEWGESVTRYDRLLWLNRRVLADDRPQAVMTMDNIQQAYGANIQALHNENGIPFVC